MTRAGGLYLIWYELEGHQMLEDLVTTPEVEPISHTQLFNEMNVLLVHVAWRNVKLNHASVG